VVSTENSGNDATGNASATAGGAIGGRQFGERATQQLAESHDTNDGQQEPRQNGQQNGAADGNAQNTEQPQDPPNSHRVAIEDGIVHLPAGTSLAAVQIAGDDIWLNQPDGSIIIITGGAADIPTFVIGDVQIPAETIAAALQNAPEAAPAAPGEGPAQAQGEGLAQPGSSGGDFSRPPGDIGAPFDLTALLPPTALLFSEPTVQELSQPLRTLSAVEQNFSLNITKDAAVADGTADEVGDVINYTITVANTGNQTLTGVTISDPSVSNLTRVADLVGDNDNLLEVGEIWSYTASYTLTQGDIDAGGTIDNTATADSAQTPEDTAEASAPVVQNPSYTISKVLTDINNDPNDTVINNAGDVLTYTVTLTNTGNQSLTGVTLSDSLVATVDSPAESLNDDDVLEVGETWTYSYDYAVTQDDINNDGGGDGTIDNTATADTDQTDPPQSDSVAVPLVQSEPAFTISKVLTDINNDTNDTVINNAGDVLTYTVTLTNTGNQSLTGVTLSDSLVLAVGPATESGGTGTNGDSILDVGETWTYSYDYTVTQDDINSDGGGDGDIDNTATADTDQTDPPQTSSVEVALEPDLVLWKIAQSDNSGTADDGTILEGGTATYAISFANEANSADLPLGQSATVRLTFDFGDTSSDDFDPAIANATTAFWQEVFDDLDGSALKIDNPTADTVRVEIQDGGGTKIGEATFDKSTGVLKVTATEGVDIPKELPLITFDLTAALDSASVVNGAQVNQGTGSGWGVAPDTNIDANEVLFVNFNTSPIQNFDFLANNFNNSPHDEFQLVGLDASGNRVAITSVTKTSGFGASINIDTDIVTISAVGTGAPGATFEVDFASDTVVQIKIIGVAGSWSLSDFTADGTSVVAGAGQPPADSYVVNADPEIVISGGTIGPANEGNESFTISLVDVDPAGDVPDGLSSMSSVTTTIEDTGEASGADPIILDLGAPGISFVSSDEGVLFDIDADGPLDQIAWPDGQDGVLVMDLDGSGKIENGAEVFSPYFGAGGFTDALDALSSLDLNGDGIIDAQDAAFADLRVWVDANQDGVSQDGELFGLNDLEIASIDLNAQPAGYQIDGQTIFAEGQYTLSSGESRPYVAVDLKQQDLAGSDLIASGGETVVGGDGDDVLLSLGGGNILYGGPGADTFVLAGLDAADLIADYNMAQADIVDLTALFTVDTLGGDSVDELSDFVQVVQNGAGDDELQVDADGGADTWTTVATLNADAGITILYDDAVTGDTIGIV